MTTVQEKLTEAVLATIRSRRNGQASRPVEAHSAPASSQSPVSLRMAEFSDFQAVARLGQRLGQGADSEENWRRLWINNPAVQSGRAASRIGWVMETGGNIVGFFGTIPLLCEFQGSTLVSAASCRFAVEPEFRSSAYLLVSSFLRQKDVDLFLNTTATPAAGKMMQALKAAPVPQEDYGTVLFWILDRRRFVEAVLHKIAMRPAVARAGGLVGSAALWGDAQLQRRFPQSASSGHDISEGGLDELPAELDSFCDEQIRSRPRLFGKRNSAILQWHFSPPGSKKVCRVFICRKNNRIQGYVVTRQELDPSTGLRRSTVADLLVSDDDPKTVCALIAAARASAMQSGNHVLEIMGFPRTIRRTLLELKPYSRRYPACPYFYKARDRALHEQLSNADAWYACAFDGDATLWP